MRPKIGEFLPMIQEILKSDQQVHRKQRHTPKRIFERLQAEHEYEGGYTGVKDAVRAWRQEHKEVFLPLSHPPGEAQVDFGEADVILRGETTRVALFVMTLPYSDAIFCQVFPRECTEAFLEGHRRAFEFFGGVPRRISYDNSKIAVARIIGSREREVTGEFLRLGTFDFGLPRFEATPALVVRPAGGIMGGGQERPSYDCDPLEVTMELRPLGNTGIQVSPIALGCWPIAGLTSAGTNDADSIATIRACFDLGINHLDTAFCYGRNGESERLIARALGRRRREMVIASKGGLHWDREGEQAHDASPAVLRSECEESLRRLQIDYVDLLYLHAPDPKVPVAESAAALRRLLEEGKTRSVGVSNLTLAQLEEFAAVCPIAAFQPPYNMLQRQIEADTLPWCRRNGVAVLVYWPLMKGLLAGKLRGDETFANDSRRKYPMFQGEEYRKNLDFVESLRRIAALSGHTVAQLVIHWTIHRPGITAALCGAKRPEQLCDTAKAAGWRLSDAQAAAIDEALAARGTPVINMPV